MQGSSTFKRTRPSCLGYFVRIGSTAISCFLARMEVVAMLRRINRLSQSLIFVDRNCPIVKSIVHLVDTRFTESYADLRCMQTIGLDSQEKLEIHPDFATK
jgi:hypothetical protein